MPRRSDELTNALDNGEIKLYVTGQQSGSGDWISFESYRLVNKTTTNRTAVLTAYSAGLQVYRAEFAPGTDTTVTLALSVAGVADFGWSLS